jgi:hypothetical protein
MSSRVDITLFWIIIVDPELVLWDVGCGIANTFIS